MYGALIASIVVPPSCHRFARGVRQWAFKSVVDEFDRSHRIFSGVFVEHVYEPVLEAGISVFEAFVDSPRPEVEALLSD